MAKQTDPAPEFDSRHRIVGAIILVSLAVIFVPMLLDGERMARHDAFDQSSQAKRSTRVVVSNADDIRRGASAVTEPTAESGSESVPATKKSTPTSVRQVLMELRSRSATGEAAKKKALPASSKPAPVVKKSRPKSVAPVVDQGWVVQVGTFSDPGNVAKLKSRLLKHGFNVNTEEIRLSSGKAIRVRVGPFGKKAVAVDTRTRIHELAGVDGVVLSYP
ncbi:MAG: SPOR domain-containing protein [Gammaproteobacteria bacterium]|nr:MAG: SPOR domain-containing protein [Gammaproteobacteria bacterium]